MVPARTSVEKTSSGMETSAAPLSSVKFNVIRSFNTTGTTNVPWSALSWTVSAHARPGPSTHKQTIPNQSFVAGGNTARFTENSGTAAAISVLFIFLSMLTERQLHYETLRNRPAL